MSSSTVRQPPVQRRTYRLPRDIAALAAAEVRAAARRRARLRVATWAARLAIIAGLLVSWQLVATYWLDRFSYSRPSDIARRLTEWFTSGTVVGPIWTQILTTLQETVAGFVIGAVSGLSAGVALGRSGFLSGVLAPLIRAANAVPRIVLASLFIIVFGLGVPSKVATALVLVFFAVFFDAFDSTHEIDESKIQESHLLGANARQTMRYVVLPYAAKRILTGLHSAFSLALTGALVSEYLGGSRGLGVLIHNAQANFDVAGIYAGMLIATAIALAAEWALLTLERRLTVLGPGAQRSA
jgi:NitT/TauT family transport system permease protein